MTRILMILTGSDHLIMKDGSRKPTGFWAEEAFAPYELFRSAGAEVIIATPGGVEAPLDESSLAPEMNAGGSDVIAHYRELHEGLEELKHPRALEEIDQQELGGFDAIFLPGGHGPMQDLSQSAPLGRLVRAAHEREMLIAAVCHGPAGLLPALDEGGRWIFTGFEMTCFTNQEEEAVGLAPKMVFLLESRLRELGARFRAREAWQPHVVVDRNLVTGQNPSSSADIAHEALARLGHPLGR